MIRSRTSRYGFAWLELLLLLSVFVLLLQIWPEGGRTLIYAVDFRNWPRTVWFFGNIFVVAMLLTVRFGPELIRDWRERREHLNAERDKKEKVRELKEQKDAAQRMKESRSRRIY